MLYKIIITKDDETGNYIAEVPTLSPCITFGETVEEAMAMAQEAIEAVVESRKENGYDLPDDSLVVSAFRSPIETFVSYQTNKADLSLQTA